MLSVARPGTKVRVIRCGKPEFESIEAFVDSVKIEGSCLHVTYLITWWGDFSRNAAYVEPHEIELIDSTMDVDVK